MTDVQLKRFLFTATIKQVEGTQTFFVDAENMEQAQGMIYDGQGDCFSEEVSVTEIGPLMLEGETTLEDYGDFHPADRGPAVRRDAARFRWLADQAQVARPDAYVSYFQLPQLLRADYHTCVQHETLGSAVDAMMGTGTGQAGPADHCLMPVLTAEQRAAHIEHCRKFIESIAQQIAKFTKLEGTEGLVSLLRMEHTTYLIAIASLTRPQENHND